MVVALTSKTQNTDIVKTLITTGADVHVQNDDGDTAIIWATKNGHADIAKVLIDAGAE